MVLDTLMMTRVSFNITCLLFLFANIVIGQTNSLEDYLMEYSKTTKVYEVQSKVFTSILSQVNDSSRHHLQCDMPALYVARVKSNVNGMIIDFDALNVWSDDTYINQISTSERYSMIQSNGIVVLCDNSVIELLHNAAQLNELEKIDCIDINRDCHGLTGTGVYYGISIDSGKASLEYFRLLRSRK